MTLAVTAFSQENNQGKLEIRSLLQRQEDAWNAGNIEEFIQPEVCLVTGKYSLKRIQDEPSGMFTLLLRKIKGRWVIVYDHTS